MEAGRPSSWQMSLLNMLSKPEGGGRGWPCPVTVPTVQFPDVCLVLSYQCIGEADNRDDHLTKGGGGQTVVYPGGVWGLPGNSSLMEIW